MIDTDARTSLYVGLVELQDAGVLGDDPDLILAMTPLGQVEKITSDWVH